MIRRHLGQHNNGRQQSREAAVVECLLHSPAVFFGGERITIAREAV